MIFYWKKKWYVVLLHRYIFHEIWILQVVLLPARCKIVFFSITLHLPSMVLQSHFSPLTFVSSTENINVWLLSTWNIILQYNNDKYEMFVLQEPLLQNGMMDLQHVKNFCHQNHLCKLWQTKWLPWQHSISLMAGW